MSQPEMMPVSGSSNVAAIGYDKATRECYVQFKSGMYVYGDVPPEIFEALAGSPSPGKFINSEFKGRYDYRRM